jgi:hypothetical protein
MQASKQAKKRNERTCKCEKMTLMGKVMTFLTVLGGMMKGIYLGCEGKRKTTQKKLAADRKRVNKNSTSDGAVGLDRNDGWCVAVGVSLGER